jgi:hypothetical protein
LSNIRVLHLSRIFRIKQGSKYSKLKEIKVGVPQGSVLVQVLYLLYTYDVPQTANTKIVTFADDTAVMAVEKISKKQQLNCSKPLTWSTRGPSNGTSY